MCATRRASKPRPKGRKSTVQPRHARLTTIQPVRVESAPADLKVTDATSMIDLWKCIYPHSCE
ncbi:hypothetical protein TSOC_010844 [Tetrabaena socialis]|uniref:Uncharacterized protein n=1 Tax=Tetrabaena socialis TaxID=47790 RepID=A0A2J7ZS96_9CHLO|nr:hypothetical protein TSOC_010844 [Tetrabaena socialis]|eukprot:PNH03137.1 hypothetical protein TSOC_010844 [Tetrabaena socialis]